MAAGPETPHPPNKSRAVPTDASRTILELKDGPRGALFLATISVFLLFAGWMAFYFLLFLPRGPIG
jgi:hypothetical protein